MSKNRFTAQTKVNIQEEPIYVCILAGATYFRELTKGPRVLQLHEGSTILEHQVRTLRQTFPNCHVAATVGFQADKVIKSRPQIPLIENQLSDTTNTMEELRLYLNTVFPHRLLLIDGAIHFNHFALKITHKPSILLYKNKDDKEIGVQHTDGELEHLEYGLNDKWSGLVYLEGKSLEFLKKNCKRENSRLSLFEGINLLLEQDISIGVIEDNRAEVVKL